MKKWLAFGSLLGASSLVVYNLNFKSKGKTQTLTILSEKKMIEVLEKIKIEYRTQFFMFQKHFRSNRRKLQRNSKEYAETVNIAYSSLPNILNQSINEVLKELNIDREIYDNSWKLLKNEQSVCEAFEDLKIITSTGNLKKDIGVEVTQEALEHCKSKFESEYGHDNLHITVSLLEDEIKDQSGFESEDLEKAYLIYNELAPDYDSIFDAFREAKYVSEF
jgi:hypothetical protein